MARASDNITYCTPIIQRWKVGRQNDWISLMPLHNSSKMAQHSSSLRTSLLPVLTFRGFLLAHTRWAPTCRPSAVYVGELEEGTLHLIQYTSAWSIVWGGLLCPSLFFSTEIFAFGIHILYIRQRLIKWLVL